MSRSAPLRIVVDARELEGRPTGVGRVVTGLLQAWPDAGDHIDLVCRQPIEADWIRSRWQVLVRPGPVRLPGTLWEQMALPHLTRGASVLLAPNYGMPRFSACPTAVCMHDCAPFALPLTFRRRERLRRRWSARLAARHAAFLFMGSQFAAAEAQRWLDMPSDRCLVIPWGCDDGFRPADASRIAAVRRRYRLPGRFVLFVGSQLQRRDLDALAQHVATLVRQRSDLQLCVVGGKPEARAKSASAPHVRRLGYVPDPDLAALYSAATVVAYPSRYEGFGLPVLEALACATPVVASNTSAVGEVFAGHAELVEHDDRGAWVAALARLLDDAQEHRAAVRRGHPWALQQHWRDSAATLRRRLAGLVTSR